MPSKNFTALPYKRVLLKLSGEGLSDDLHGGISQDAVNELADELSQIHELGVQMGVVVGGGNIFRGVMGAAQGMDRATADQIGMLATIMNALAIQDALTKRRVSTRIMSAIEVGRMAEPFIRARALKHLEKGRIVIFAAGTGNPFFTTDTAAALRALEIKADLLMKATSVDGIYDRDPKKYPEAVKFNNLTYQDVLEMGLKVMDASAVSMARDGRLPIIVFNMKTPGNIKGVIMGKPIGTIVRGG
ncbi:MAG: UMP kinase [Dissulfurimicrobium hydrothermale]|uniref:UMP kinase n=1 Tax=Dissulfurimicrobium hydrothermale TaxID=1750598 RepID=UPI003C70A0EC